MDSTALLDPKLDTVVSGTSEVDLSCVVDLKTLEVTCLTSSAVTGEVISCGGADTSLLVESSNISISSP